MNRKYKKIVLGGTFDHFHKGHEAFLKKAFIVSENVLIGITSNAYVFKNKKGVIENFEIRKKSVISFLKKKKFIKNAEIIAINDIFGPTLEDKNIDAILVSKQDITTAEIINLKRQKNNLKKMKIVLGSTILGEDKAIISSKKIREGKINREGKLYVNNKWLRKKLILPFYLRKSLEKPFGKLYKNKFTFNNKFGFAVVGDIITSRANEEKVKPQIAIFDFLVKRKKLFKNIEELGFIKNKDVIKVINPAGSISSDLFRILVNTFENKKKTLILIKGEDDLAVLPLILCAPLNFYIYYGQPDKGVVEILVTEDVKEKAYKLASRFM